LCRSPPSALSRPRSRTSCRPFVPPRKSCPPTRSSPASIPHRAMPSPSLHPYHRDAIGSFAQTMAGVAAGASEEAVERAHGLCQGSMREHADLLSSVRDDSPGFVSFFLPTNSSTHVRPHGALAEPARDAHPASPLWQPPSRPPREPSAHGRVPHKSRLPHRAP
jgi:hypothetical protein